MTRPRPVVLTEVEASMVLSAYYGNVVRWREVIADEATANALGCAWMGMPHEDLDSLAACIVVRRRRR